MAGMFRSATFLRAVITKNGTKVWMTTWYQSGRVDIEIATTTRPGLAKFTRFNKLTKEEVDFFLATF